MPFQKVVYCNYTETMKKYEKMGYKYSNEPQVVEDFIDKLTRDNGGVRPPFVGPSVDSGKQDKDGRILYDLVPLDLAKHWVMVEKPSEYRATRNTVYNPNYYHLLWYPDLDYMVFPVDYSFTAKPKYSGRGREAVVASGSIVQK